MVGLCTVTVDSSSVLDCLSANVSKPDMRGGDKSQFMLRMCVHAWWLAISQQQARGDASQEYRQ